MTDEIPPLMFVWTPDAGPLGAMVPYRGHARRIAAHYEPGMGYLLHPAPLGSTPFERGFFAAVNEAWKNLPENKHEEYPTSEHLRKRALIKCGFYNLAEQVFDTEKDAQRAAAIAKGDDEYCVVVASGTCVRKYTAQSMKIRTTDDRKKFKEMANAVLDLLSATIGVRRSELEREGKIGRD